MKPIRLTLKGLNSFVEEQSIDFNKLTDKGLFGIFGPTGSGKSTVLDGITLALYGKTARDSSDFINAKGEAASIRFEFQIREAKVEHYIIDRSFRRNGSGGINAKKPTRIIQIIDGEEMILEDTPTKVDKKCIEIIGLKFEDFIRTVVLPQGKFSEFLKLEGTPKRDMLERLFSLNKYGDGLSRKLSSVIRTEKSQMDRLEGQLKAYEEISEEVYATKMELLEATVKEEKEATKVVEEALSAFKEGEALWLLQEELKKYGLQEKALDAQKEVIQDKKVQVEKGENALKVKPYLDAVSRTQKEMMTIEEKWEKDKQLLGHLEERKGRVQTQFEEAKQSREKKLPELNILIHNIEEALEEEKLKVQLEAERTILRSEFIRLNNEKKFAEDELKKYNEAIQILDTTIEEKEKQREALKIEQKDRGDIQEGLLLQSQCYTAGVNKESLEKNIEEENIILKELEEKRQILKKHLEKKKETLQQEEAFLKRYVEKCPGDATMLLQRQDKLNTLKTAWQIGTKAEQNLVECKKHKEEMQNAVTQYAKEKEEKEKKVKGLKEKIEKLREEGLAHLLREKLGDGVPCPVCGSLTHQTVAYENEDTSKLQEYEQLLEQEEQKKRILENKWLIEQTRLIKEEEKQQQLEEELNGLEEGWKNVDIATCIKQFEEMQEAITLWTKEKDEKERAIKELSEELGREEIEYSKVQSALTENQKNVTKYVKDLEKVEREYKHLYEKLVALETRVGVKDFVQKDKMIKDADKKREVLEKELTKDRLERKEKEEKRELLKKHADKWTDELATIRTQGEAKKNQIEEKMESIKRKVGERTDLSLYKEEVQQTILMIENAFVKLEEDKKQLEQSYGESLKEVEAGKIQITSLKIRLQEEAIGVKEALAVQGFKDEISVKACLKTESEIKQLKECIKQYEVEVSQLQGKRQEVKEKIKGRVLTEEAWQKLKMQREMAEGKLNATRTVIAQLGLEVQQIGKQLEDLKAILKTQKALEHKLSLLKDLESLFKGKRFVQFVAMHQLRYISMEASKRLKSITSGTYGLELDENGKFIIRDYKNGGATRDASTLSGGETFLASLALALSLSSQIQLKGTAPLELFFLDEGFGTLDDGLLDVVMSSLEKLHNDRLSVGIISHVESIKNRVPMKLILTSAEAGVGGSKVTLDRS